MIIISNLHNETKALLVVMILGDSCLIGEALKMKANEWKPLILRPASYPGALYASI